jgi:hypothetical protein
MKRDRRKSANRGFRQGDRKRDKWGLCKDCGLPAAFRRDRCSKWRYFGNWVFARQTAALQEGKPDVPVEHGKLVRLPGTVGRFQFRLYAAVSPALARARVSLTPASSATSVPRLAPWQRDERAAPRQLLRALRSFTAQGLFPGSGPCAPQARSDSPAAR